jgi:hypothetical protein
MMISVRKICALYLGIIIFLVVGKKKIDAGRAKLLSLMATNEPLEVGMKLWFCDS